MWVCFTSPFVSKLYVPTSKYSAQYKRAISFKAGHPLAAEASGNKIHVMLRCGFRREKRAILVSEFYNVLSIEEKYTTNFEWQYYVLKYIIQQQLNNENIEFFEKTLTRCGNQIRHIV